MVNVTVSLRANSVPWCSIDPGVNSCAIASWRGSYGVAKLTRVYFAEEVVTLGGVVIEMPSRVHGSTEGDIVALARAAERCVRRLPHDLIRYLDPSEWKGQANKAQHNLLVWQALTDDERKVLVSCYPRGPNSVEKIEAGLHEQCRKLMVNPQHKPSWKMKDVLDAIGIGLFHAGRIDKYGRKTR